MIINGLKVTVIRHNIWHISTGNAKPNTVKVATQIAQLLRSTSDGYPVDAYAVGWILVFNAITALAVVLVQEVKTDRRVAGLVNMDYIM